MSQGWLPTLSRLLGKIGSRIRRTPILGLDIGKDQLEAVLLRDEQAPEHAQVPNTKKGFNQLWRFLKKRRARQAQVCMEASGLYYEGVADFLHAKGATVSVVNPARIIQKIHQPIYI